MLYPLVTKTLFMIIYIVFITDIISDILVGETANYNTKSKGRVMLSCAI